MGYIIKENKIKSFDCSKNYWGNYNSKPFCTHEQDPAYKVVK
jgi:hypothetical protein